MKARPKPPLSKGRPDDFQTPPEALKPLFQFIDSEWMIWECAAGDGNLVVGLESEGYSVIGTDILTGHDFIRDPPLESDMILTNPPYSIRDKFLKRCYGLGRPFALLMPLTSFEGRLRQKLFSTHGIEVIFMPKRINFKTPSGNGGGSWFMTAWFTWGLNIGNELYFYNRDSSLNDYKNGGK